ncbi:MAG: protein phosphatase CheZ [Nitrospira sp.]|nr:protein phosphatase CheZ [Nitrospira sp.]MDH4302546.1 protein phosphatase CheZ [Nitrospira sp.]MDH5193260.1 protein phosphatase CheZ [Nitrospira sp.]
METQGHKLYEELGSLARFVDNAMNAISSATPQIMSSSTQLPTAAAHLTDLKKMTEDGTLEVMRLTELVQDSHAQMAKELSGVADVLKAMDCVTLAGRLEQVRVLLGQDEKHLMEIMTTLSFQDLVAQRVKKLVTILDEVQTKLVELVVVFGLQRNGNEAAGTGIADQMLKQLEQSKTTAMKQQVADDLLAQFGFK